MEYNVRKDHLISWELDYIFFLAQALIIFL